MIYFDNAATTLHKPQAVIDAVTKAMQTFGGPGRGSHAAALDASMAVFGARQAVAQLLGAPGPQNVSFTMNATMALNIAIDGLLPAGAVALTTAASHNSVLRPLYRARDERDCEMRVAPIHRDGSLDWAAYERMLDGAALVAVTHASNVTGDVYDVARMASLAHDAGALFVLDAAQTAGDWPLSFADLGVDVLCFTGHKALYGPQGTGGLVVREGVDIPPLLEGGSGVHSYDERHPCAMPESLEAGTANAHGLAGLAAGVKFLSQTGVENVSEHIEQLANQFRAGVQELPGVNVQGGQTEGERCGIVALNILDVDSGVVSDALSQRWGICTRPGAHCAPLMHCALGTREQGVVRFSFGYFNTADEVDAAVNALAQLSFEFVNK